MKPRKAKDIQKVLKKKGFVLNPEKEHHQFFYLNIDGKKHAIYTYFSHNNQELGKSLMNLIKKQLKFKDTEKAEQFLDCPMSKEQYLEMLIELEEITK